MSTGYKIEWSTRAVDDFNQIIQYLSENWSKREIREFVHQIDKTSIIFRLLRLSFPLHRTIRG